MTKGYTLIEILVGITIIGLLFGLGFVSFREFSRRQSLAGTAKNLIGDLRLTQQMALSGQKPEPVNSNCQTPYVLNGYNFKVNSTSNYSIEALCSGSETGIETKNVDLPLDISISIPSTNPILFKALGQGTNIAAGQSMVLTLTQVGTSNQTTITISSSGEIK